MKKIDEIKSHGIEFTENYTMDSDYKEMKYNVFVQSIKLKEKIEKEKLKSLAISS